MNVTFLANGQITRLMANKFLPSTTFIYEIHITTNGYFSIPEYSIQVNGQAVEVPAASLNVLPKGNSPPPEPRQLTVEISSTNVYLGEPIRVRVMLPTKPGSPIDALREVELNNTGLMVNKTSLRQSIETLNIDGQLRQSFVYEITVTPIATGSIDLTAQGFSSGRDLVGPITISGPVNLTSSLPGYVLLVSDPLKINVRPLPMENGLPGFTGAIGKFIAEKPRLSAAHVHVGELLHLSYGFHGDALLTRFVPPEPPHDRDWQIFEDKPAGTGFTLIPLTDEARETPAIPFCSFDPETGKYLDLTIPSLPVTVIGESLPTQLSLPDETKNKVKPARLSAFATKPGRATDSLKPLQLRGWFIALQLLPALIFLALWRWDRHRRFLEAHPDIVRRRQANRALRREKALLQKAVAAADAKAFARHAVKAMQVACAPHFPAHPEALVCGEVLSQLDDAGQSPENGKTVRKLFEVADSRFSPTPRAPIDLPRLHQSVQQVLQKLEEKL